MAPRAWVPLDHGFPTAPKIQALLAEFGTVGPYVYVVLLATAKGQSFTRLKGGAGQAGSLTLAWPLLAHLAADSVDTVRAVVARMEALGELNVTEPSDVALVASFPDWDLWDVGPKDPTAAERKRHERDRKRDITVTDA